MSSHVRSFSEVVTTRQADINEGLPTGRREQFAGNEATSIQGWSAQLSE